MIEIAPEPFDSPESMALREELRRELDARYGSDLEPGEKPTEEDVTLFVVAREDGHALGCGALRSIPRLWRSSACTCDRPRAGVA